jgi:hypothetical protein
LLSFVRSDQNCRSESSVDGHSWRQAIWRILVLYVNQLENKTAR